jgi:hypothetical protein
MKLGYDLQVVLTLTHLLQEHLKYRALEPEVELHLEGHEEGDCVTLTVLTPGCHWNLMLDTDALLHLASRSPNRTENSHEELSRAGRPEELARAAFERIKARLPLTTYTSRP